MKILVVDDERAVRDSLRRALELEGYEIELAGDGREALYRLDSDSQPDAIILDVLMPGLDGLEVCRRLRATGNSVPVLMLTARAAVTERVEGLDAGADDYLVKPFALDALLARLRAFERRAPQSGQSRGTLRFGDVVLDRDAMSARRGSRPITLSRTEYQLLELLMSNARRVLWRTVIFEKVWGYDFGPESNSLDVYIG